MMGERRFFCAHCAHCRRLRGGKAGTIRHKVVRSKHKMAGGSSNSASSAAKIDAGDKRRPEDRTEHTVAPILGVSVPAAKKLVQKFKVPIFDTNVLRKSKDGYPDRERFMAAQMQCLQFIEVEENRRAIEAAFQRATGEKHLNFDYKIFFKRVLKTKLTTRFRKDFEEAMAFSVDNGTTKVYPIFLDAAFPLTTQAMTSLILHECLHWFCTRRGRPGNPRLSQDVEHAAMMLLGDKDMSKAV